MSRLTNRCGQEPPCRAAYRFAELENHRCEPGPVPATMPKLRRSEERHSNHCSQKRSQSIFAAGQKLPFRVALCRAGIPLQKAPRAVVSRPAAG